MYIYIYMRQKVQEELHAGFLAHKQKTDTSIIMGKTDADPMTGINRYKLKQGQNATPNADVDKPTNRATTVFHHKYYNQFNVDMIIQPQGSQLLLQFNNNNK